MQAEANVTPGYPQPAARVTARLLIAAGTAILLLTAVREGWKQQTTDFPNYYTAALLTRQHAPLRNFYDWTWFQKQITLTGFESQLGAYTAQPPLAMVPIIPLAGYAPQTARRIWISASLIFLVATIWLLSLVTELTWEQLSLMALAGFGSLYTNFLYGQYYLFLLFLLSASFYWLERGRTGISGAAAGVAFGLKLYGGPLLAFYAVKRQWRGALGLLISSAALAACAIALFGWGDCVYYFTHVLPRSLDGSASDPYNAGNATLSSLLRRLFVKEPELNPVPTFNAPWAFFFLRTFTSSFIAIFPCLGILMGKNRSNHRDFAFFLIAVLLLSTSLSSYSYILLLLPVALLLEGSPPSHKTVFLLLYVLLNAPLWQAGRIFTTAFVKLWLLIALFALAGRAYLHLLTPRTWIVMFALLAAVSGLDAFSRMKDYRQEPGQRYERVAVQPGAMLSTYPVILRDGLFYESLDLSRQRYVLRWLHNGETEIISFPGHASYPIATSSGAIRVESVRDGQTTPMQFDPATRAITPLNSGDLSRSPADQATSPDGRWTAFTADESGQQHLRLKDRLSGQVQQLTGGRCNSSWPAWTPDSTAIVFASDCGRSLGLTSLYRVPIVKK